ncbi:putative glutaredoxin, Thioredoxin-like superfamily [Helianthus debilis subsp. tardiflorus]
MSCSITFHSQLASSSRIPSFEFVSRASTINRSALRYQPRTATFGTLKFSSHAIKTGVPSRRVGCFAALSPELKTTLDKVVTSHKVIVFMKGTKDFPQCGFSNTVVSILKAVNVPFETVNILENEILRQGLKEYSQWPTFPQLYIDGEFFGGCDITVDAYKSGELQEILEKASLS